MPSPMNRNWACAIFASLAFLISAAILPAVAVARPQAQQPDQQNAIQKQVGAIKSIVGNTVTITTDSGSHRHCQRPARHQDRSRRTGTNGFEKRRAHGF